MLGKKKKEQPKEKKRGGEGTKEETKEAKAPFVLNFGEMKSISAYLPDKNSWTLVTILGVGGFGEVALFHHQKYGNIVVKRIAIARDENKQMNGEQYTNILRQVNFYKMLAKDCAQYFTCFSGVFYDQYNYYVISLPAKGLNVRDGKAAMFLVDHTEEKLYPVIKVFVRSFLTALYLLHTKDIAHGDIKPENILIDVPTGQCRLIDFDGACVGPKKCAEAPMVWTQLFLPPEFKDIKIDTFLGITTSLDARKSIDCWCTGSTILFLCGYWLGDFVPPQPTWNASLRFVGSWSDDLLAKVETISGCSLAPFVAKDPALRPAAAGSGWLLLGPSLKKLNRDGSPI